MIRSAGSPRRKTVHKEEDGNVAAVKRKIKNGFSPVDWNRLDSHRWTHTKVKMIIISNCGTVYFTFVANGSFLDNGFYTQPVESKFR
jgi:hypothetical protein